MKALFRMIFGHTEARRDGGAEGKGCLTRRRGGAEVFSHKGHKEEKEGSMEVGMNDSTIQRSNGPTVFSHKEHKEHTEQKVEATMSNHPTTKLPNCQTTLGQLARWAAVAAVAGGERLERAREEGIAA